MKLAKGVTLVELVVTLLVISVGVLGLIGAFKGISQSIYFSKTRTLATNLAQENIEALKNISYYRLLVTTAPAYAPETGLGGFPYDKGYYPPETINVGGITFERRTYIEKVQENSGTGLITAVSPTNPDTDLKKITTYVVWQEGTDWKSISLRNLRENPNRQVLNATFNGSVTKAGSGTDIEDALVTAVQNPNQYDLTDSSGDYSFNIAAGTYTLRASKHGYFPAQSVSYNVTSGANQTANFTLTEMATGTATGMIYLRDHPVISQVVASSGTQNGVKVEFIELYNPTTYAWNINAATLEVMYREKNTGPAATPISINFNSTSIPSNGYYLIASTSPIKFRNITRTADATYNPPVINDEKDGGIGIRLPSSSSYYDRVAWAKASGPDPPTDLIETTAITMTSDGLDDGEQIVRKVNESAANSTQGRAYDSNNNALDFVADESVPADYNANNSSVIQTPVTGTPAAGALVFANDELSSPATASSTGYYILTGISTGTWTLAASSGTWYGENTSLTITPSTFVVQNIYLTSSTTNGYITGMVVSASGTGLAGIKVGAGGSLPSTNSAGHYYMPVAPSTYTVTANPGNNNPVYASADFPNVIVNTGQLTSNIDFTLSQGGKVRGYISTNGTDPLPNIPVSATRSGLEYGFSLSGSDGYFTITNLSTGTYTFTPATESGETCSPVSVSSAVVSNSTVFVSTFVISNAFGKITGTLTVNSSTITTGVLIVVTTGTITGDDPPPTINNSLRSGSQTYYGTSSLTGGTYEIRVPGSVTTYNVYAWYTTWNGSTPTITKRSATATVAAGATVTRNLSW